MHYLIDNLWKAISQIMSNGKESLEKKTTEKTNNASVIIYVINNYIEEEVGDDEEKKPMIKQSATMINTELRDGNKTTSLAKKHGNNKQQKSTTKLADKILKTSELTTQSLKLSPSKNHTNIFSSKSTKKAKEKSGRVRVKKPEIDTTSSIILPKMNLDTKIVLSSVTTVSDTQSRMTAYPFQNISSNYSIGDKATTKSLKKITNNSISQKLTTKIENRPTEAIQMSTDFAKIDEHNFDAPNAFGNQSSTSIVTSTEAMKIETKLTTMKYQNLSVPMKEEDSKRKQTKQNQQMQNKKVISLTTRTVKKIATNKKKSKVSSQVLFGMSAHLPKNNSVKFISKIIKTISIPLSIAASSTETKNVSKTSRRNFMDANAFSKISLKNNTTKALLKLSTLEPKTTKRSLSIKTSSESNNFQAKKKNSLKTMVTSNTIAPAKTTGVMKSKEVILKSNVSRANFSSSVTETLTSPKFEINSQAFSLPTLSQLLPVTMATSQTLNNNSQLSTNNPSMLNVIADDEVEIENTSSLTSANNSSDHLLEKNQLHYHYLKILAEYMDLSFPHLLLSQILNFLIT
ncbi:unnamed protein product [Thelazia callipaeda]|uniref:Uncharacterized protein n=1 Tax=Thelazia callipaeda TaxID=103827 RepID=A0A0N5CV60_THECL|nr:unnamed protein product [Thelazia callipaeda]